MRLDKRVSLFDFVETSRTTDADADDVIVRCLVCFRFRRTENKEIMALTRVDRPSPCSRTGLNKESATSQLFEVCGPLASGNR